MAALNIDMTPWIEAYRRADEYLAQACDVVEEGGDPDEVRRLLNLATAALVHPFGEPESDGDKVARAVTSAWKF